MSAIDSREVAARAHAAAARDTVRDLVREADVRTVAVGAYALAVLIMLVLVVSAFRSGGELPRSPDRPSPRSEPRATPVPATKPTEPTAQSQTQTKKSRPATAGGTRPTPGAEPKLPPAGGAHTVSPGDTLSAIAGRYATTIDELLRLNPGIDPYALKSGQRIRIP